MRICWDNLEKLEYVGNGKWQDKKWKNTFYTYKETCRNCSEPFLAQKIEGLYCCHYCSTKRKYYISDEQKRSISKKQKGKIGWSRGIKRPGHSKRMTGTGNPNFGNRKYTDLEYKNWQEYKEKVRTESYATYKLYKKEINPENLKIGRREYHLDHKYSIYDGFYNDVPIKIISHPKNLQILFCKDNLKKQKNSCITLSELKGEI